MKGTSPHAFTVLRLKGLRNGRLSVFRFDHGAYRRHVRVRVRVSGLDVIEADTHSECVSYVCVSGRLGVSG